MVFEFKDNMLHLQFGSKKYDVSPTQTMVEMKCIKDISEEIDNAVYSGKKDIKDACITLTVLINRILGDDALKDIFADRIITYEDIADIIAYINNELTAYYTAKQNSYADVQNV